MQLTGLATQQGIRPLFSFCFGQSEHYPRVASESAGQQQAWECLGSEGKSAAPGS